MIKKHVTIIDSFCNVFITNTYGTKHRYNVLSSMDISVLLKFDFHLNNQNHLKYQHLKVCLRFMFMLYTIYITIM